MRACRAYDPAGNVTRVIDADGNVTYLGYDGLNRLILERIFIGGVGRDRTWTYDAAGNLTEYKDRDGGKVNYGYDALNRRIIEIGRNKYGQWEGKSEFTYDQDGNAKSATSFTFANGQFVEVSKYEYSSYDVRGRAKQLVQTVSAGSASQSVTFAYDYFDNLGGSGAARYGYTSTASNGGTVYYINTYHFDAAGREVLAEQKVPGSSQLDKKVVREYYVAGEAIPGDGTVQTTRNDRWTRFGKNSGESSAAYAVVGYSQAFYEPNDPHLLMWLYHLKADGSYLVKFKYGYDAADRLRYRDDNGQSDDSDWIPLPPHRPAAQAAYNRMTELRNGYTGQIAYDLEGHVTSFNDNSDGNVSFDHTLVWQWGDRLAKTTVYGTDSSFYYDAFGKLIVTQIGGQTQVAFLDGGVETLRFDAGQAAPRLREFNSASGELYATDLPMSGAKSRVSWAMFDGDGSTRSYTYFEFDADGDPVEGGSGIGTVTYTPYGGYVQFDPEGESGLIRYHGATYYGGGIGAYDGKHWRDEILEGRTLSVVSSMISDRYSVPDGVQKSGWLDTVQTGLSFLGFIPFAGAAFDNLNGGIYMARGMNDEAFLSFASAVPIAGDAAAAAKAYKTVGAFARYSGKLAVRAGAQNAFGQAGAMYLNGDRQFSYGQVAMATAGAGLGPAFAAGMGRLVGASRNVVFRATMLAGGQAAFNAGGSILQQGIDNGSVDWGQVGYAAAMGAVSGSLGQAFYDPTCFSGDTKLDTPEGRKRIDQFVIDDEIMQQDEHDLQASVTVGRVEEIFVRTGLIFELIVNGRRIETTAEHPFYVVGQGWTPAGQLIPGTVLLGREGRPLVVDGVRDTGRTDTVYNLRIAPGHTYFVSGDDWGFSVWAHNANYVYRGDDAPRRAASPKNGIAKPYINRAGDLRPASLTGEFNGRQVSIGEHVLGGFRAAAKSNSPFISVTADQAIAAGYGSKAIRVDLKRLRAAIRSGDVVGVKVYTPSQVRRAIQNDPNLSPFWKRLAASWATRDNEYLIRGVVPSQYVSVGA